MECSDLANKLTDFLEGDLEPEVEAAAIEHLATCSACETVLADTQEVIGLIGEHGRASLTGDDRMRLWERLLGEAHS